MKQIKIKLSTKSINKAISEVREYKRQVERRAAELVNQLTVAGEEVAKIKAADIHMTGTLLRSIHSTVVGNHGIVQCSCDYAVFVEFGTGVVGSDHQHPDISILGWKYDVNGHGELGWWYPTTEADTNPTKYKTKSGELVAWTKGMPSRPFMYETARELERLVEPTARGVFR